MKFKKSLKMVPIIVGLTTTANLYAKTEMAYNERDISKNLINADLRFLELSREGDNLMFNNEYNKLRFNSLLNNWYKETAFSSNLNSIINNKNFVQILSFGKKAIPLIIEEINNKPSYLVWALNIILNKKISKENITISEASRKWVNWWNAIGSYNA
jgi:hypothetical protein